MRFIMVTHWKKHWDRLENNRTYYGFSMLRNFSVADLEKILENKRQVPAIFIKLKENKVEPEKAWEGYTYDFEIDNTQERIYFRVIIEKEISIPFRYRNYKEGWYVEALGETIPEDIVLFPPLFYIARKTNDWNKFEEYVYYLLKLIGIHNLYLYRKQRGTPDGFFKLGNLAVIYDATLEKNFEEVKKNQIKNYCSLLKSGKIEFGSTTVDVSSCKKQVWIITRGLSPRVIKEEDEVVVKEIPIDSLIEIYKKRIEENLREDQLEDELKNI